MTAAVPPTEIKKEITSIASHYGLEVVGYLRLDKTIAIPADEMEMLKGVRMSDSEVDMSKIKDPALIMPEAKAMIILGKRLMDDRVDISYRFSGDYTASIEMMLLEVASMKVIDTLSKRGYASKEYTSYYLKVWAVLAGLGWIGKSRMFVSKTYGPRLRLKGVLTDADLGEPCEVLDDARCGQCKECLKACPVGAITETEVDRKKCGACPVNHHKFREYAYSYCTACTASCPVGKKQERRSIRP